LGLFLASLMTSKDIKQINKRAQNTYQGLFA